MPSEPPSEYPANKLGAYSQVLILDLSLTLQAKNPSSMSRFNEHVQGSRRPQIIDLEGHQGASLISQARDKAS